jgi:hypothetical protein
VAYLMNKIDQNYMVSDKILLKKVYFCVICNIGYVKTDLEHAPNTCKRYKQDPVCKTCVKQGFTNTKKISCDICKGYQRCQICMVSVKCSKCDELTCKRCVSYCDIGKQRFCAVCVKCLKSV